MGLIEAPNEAEQIEHKGTILKPKGFAGGYHRTIVTIFEFITS